MTNAANKVLVVSPSSETTNKVRDIINLSGNTALTASNLTTATALILDQSPDLIVIDHNLPLTQRNELVDYITKEFSQTPFLHLSRSCENNLEPESGHQFIEYPCPDVLLATKAT